MSTEDTKLSTGFGDVTLSRHSRSNSKKEQNLRPWDAADELMLAHLAEQKFAPGTRFLIANDQYGALTTSLTAANEKYQIDFATDSFLSQKATAENLVLNEPPDTSVTWHSSLDDIEGKVDVVLIKLPKSLSLLEDQLYRYRDACTDNTQVIAAGMIKHMSPGAFKLFEKILGSTNTSLAKKKARLIFCTVEERKKITVSPYPMSFKLENTDHQIENHANVFSRESLDIGTRFLLENLPEFHDRTPLKIADLGSGNGVVGLVAAERCPEATIDFYDESYMALASSKTTFERAFPDRTARYIADDCMSSADAGQYDLVICNPPLHQHHVVGDFVAQQMFRDAKHAMKTGGELRVVANRHLDYFNALKRLFGNGQLIANNKKFVVLKAIKR